MIQSIAIKNIDFSAISKSNNIYDILILIIIFNCNEADNCAIYCNKTWNVKTGESEGREMAPSVTRSGLQSDNDFHNSYIVK